MSCVCLSGDDSDIKSFKVTVSYDDRDVVLDASIWPENITVRKYYKKRSMVDSSNNRSIKIGSYDCNIRKKVDIVKELCYV